jgi:hypothetical protein
MIIVEPGHVYKLKSIDGAEGESETLRFVNREPGSEHAGTQTQEVLRSLIDRTMHCDNCLRWAGNDKIIYHLRMALVLHEARALERKTEKGIIQPELVYTSMEDGHFTIHEEGDDGACCPPNSEDNLRYTAKPKTDPLTSGKPIFCTRD